MPEMPSTVDVICPRCATAISCTLAVELAPPKPRSRVALRAHVPDLADRFAEHYRDAGHVDEHADHVHTSALYTHPDPDRAVFVAPQLGIGMVAPWPIPGEAGA